MSEKHKTFSKNKGKNQSENILLEVLTPVHIGSGMELRNNLDFVLKDTNPFVVDIDKTLSTIQPDDPKLKNYLNTASLKDLVSIAGKEFGYSIKSIDGGLSLNLQKQETPTSSNTSHLFSSGSKVRLPFKKPDSNKQKTESLNNELENMSIREQIKDAFFRPYIPASSLKGALRTALWAEVLSTKSSHQLIDSLFKSSKSKSDIEVKKSKSNQKEIKIEELIFGETPQQDIMRALHISDGYFPQENICLGDIKIFNVTERGCKWRNMTYSQRGHYSKNIDQWRKAKGIYIEMLQEGALAEFDFCWDEFLLSDFISWQNSSNQQGNESLAFHSVKNNKNLESMGKEINKTMEKETEKTDKASFNKESKLRDIKNSFKGISKNLFPKNFMDWRSILNRHALRTVQNEKNFFSKYAHPPALEFYKELENKIQEEDSKKEGGFAYLRLGWGSGWTGMTGLTKPLLNKNQALKKFTKHRNYKMQTQNPYPKTRRLLVKSGSPSAPLGWVKLCLSDGNLKNRTYRSTSTGTATTKPLAEKGLQSAGVSSKSSSKFSPNSSTNFPSFLSPHFSPHFSPWLEENIHKLMKEHNIPDPDGVLKGKPLAEEWKSISDKKERQSILEEIKTYWKSKDWWEKPPGRSFKKTKAIYEES